MGDRANVNVKEQFGNDVSSVFLYTHWSGSDLPGILQNALKRGRERWDDGQYLARIIFQEMLGGNTTGLTGYGISSIVGDGDTRVLLVDVDKQAVVIQTKSYGGETYDEKSFTFDDYVSLPEPRWYDGDEED